MSPFICKKCKKVIQSVPQADQGKCPNCGDPIDENINFSNNDNSLYQQVQEIRLMRKDCGLEGLVEGLDSIIINTEVDNQQQAILELENYTGLKLNYVFEDNSNITALMQTANSANFVIKSRKKTGNPFQPFNNNPKSESLPNTRLETFVFNVKDLSKYVEIQKERGFEFLTPEIEDNDSFAFIQSKLSKYLGVSYGFIQWNQGNQNYQPNEAKELNWDLKHQHFAHQKNIYQLDHTATRVRARDRDLAIAEFMQYTNYNFDFAVYVKHLNSITSVSRLSDKDFAMVFTSGIQPFTTYEEAGPTERYIYNYGTRTHHMAFHTEKIEDTFASLQENGMDFLIELVGSEEDGLKQTFSVQSPNTMLVNEYIHRYGDFDGFFTKSNVTDLTRATEKQ
jgi:4-hydroxyphenylpyruvate dioxygenase-like putative hemolysin